MLLIFLLVGFCAQLLDAKVITPTRVPEDYPKTSFTCLDRPLNAFYGDAETNCEMFHICLLTAKGSVEDIRMQCPYGSVFDQETGSCRKSHEVDCLRNAELTEKVAGRLVRFWSNNKKMKRQVSETQEPNSVPDVDVKPRFTEPPRFNEHHLPVTSFSCRGKVIGGYYADPETRCQMFHVCLYVEERDHVMDTKFLCLNGTVFDQEHFVCNDWWKVDCEQAERYYDRNFKLFHVRGALF